MNLPLPDHVPGATKKVAPLWREMEQTLMARGFAPMFDHTDYGALLALIEAHMREATNQGSAFLRCEARRADLGQYH